MEDRMINKMSGYDKYAKGLNHTKCYTKDDSGKWKEIYTDPHEEGKIDSLHEGEHIVIYRNMYKIIVKAYDEEYNCFQFFLEPDDVEGSRRGLYYK